MRFFHRRLSSSRTQAVIFALSLFLASSRVWGHEKISRIEESPLTNPVKKNFLPLENFDNSPFYSSYSSLNFLNQYEESSLKRAEIIFFLSLPFIVLSHAVAVAASYYLATQESSFSGFPSEPFVFIGVSSLMITGGIIYLDIKKTSSSYRTNQINRLFRLYYKYNF